METAYDAYVKNKELRVLANRGVEIVDDKAPVEKHLIRDRVERRIAFENERARELSSFRVGPESKHWQTEVYKQSMAELGSIRKALNSATR